jgi:hypothetical protein
LAGRGQFNPRTVSRRQSEQAADNHQLRRFKSTDQNRRLRDRPPKSALGQLPLARIGINLNLVATSQMSNKNLRDITPVCPADVAEMTRLSHFGYWA